MEIDLRCANVANCEDAHYTAGLDLLLLRHFGRPAHSRQLCTRTLPDSAAIPYHLRDQLICSVTGDELQFMSERIANHSDDAEWHPTQLAL